MHVKKEELIFFFELTPCAISALLSRLVIEKKKKKETETKTTDAINRFPLQFAKSHFSFLQQQGLILSCTSSFSDVRSPPTGHSHPERCSLGMLQCKFACSTSYVLEKSRIVLTSRASSFGMSPFACIGSYGHSGGVLQLSFSCSTAAPTKHRGCE